MALSDNKAREFEYGEYNGLPVAGSTHIYEGSAVGDNGSGYSRPLQGGDPFRGFALYEEDNSDGSAGDRNVRIHKEGVIKLDVANVSGVGDVGKKVYASDDDTFTTVSSGNSVIGEIIRHISGTTCMVSFNAANIAIPPKVKAISKTETYGDMTDNGDATGYFDFDDVLPAGAIPLATKFEVATGFTGDTSATAQCGVSGDLDRFTEQATLDVFSAGTKGSTPPADTLNGIDSDQTPRVTVTSGSDFSSVSSGEMTATLYYVEP